MSQILPIPKGSDVDVLIKFFLDLCVSDDLKKGITDIIEKFLIENHGVFISVGIADSYGTFDTDNGKDIVSGYLVKMEHLQHEDIHGYFFLRVVDNKIIGVCELNNDEVDDDTEATETTTHVLH